MNSHVRARSESRDARLQALGYRDYRHYLASPEWMKVKAHYRKLVIEACLLCGRDESLALHHMTYERVGNETPSDLVWLCGNCHAMIHTLEARGDIGLDFTGLTDFKRAAEYAVEQRLRRQESEQDIADALYAPERIQNHADKVSAAVKQGVITSNGDQHLIDDMYAILNEAAASRREGREYTPMFAAAI